MNSVEIITKEQCFSCRACEHTCPTDCIRMEEDVEGFLYPVIDSTLCTSCGACLLHCPAHTPLRLIGEYSQSFYGLKLRDEHQLQKSASGGLFYGLARYVLDQGGTVFGAAYDDQLGVHQIAVSDGDALYRLRGSKYVASDTETSYVQVKEALKRGVPVLYTPSGEALTITPFVTETVYSAFGSSVVAASSVVSASAVVSADSDVPGLPVVSFGSLTGGFSPHPAVRRSTVKRRRVRILTR